jgi:hypothetical protein
MFAEQERKALELGRRMAEANFSVHDNPFTHVHPRFATQWVQGFMAASTLRSIGSSMARQALGAGRNAIAAA